MKCTVGVRQPGAVCSGQDTNRDSLQRPAVDILLADLLDIYVAERLHLPLAGLGQGHVEFTAVAPGAPDAEAFPVVQHAPGRR